MRRFIPSDLDCFKKTFRELSIEEQIIEVKYEADIQARHTAIGINAALICNLPLQTSLLVSKHSQVLNYKLNIGKVLCATAACSAFTPILFFFFFSF